VLPLLALVVLLALSLRATALLRRLPDTASLPPAAAAAAASHSKLPAATAATALAAAELSSSLALKQDDSGKLREVANAPAAASQP
jgi:hypothetical protein